MVLKCVIFDLDGVLVSTDEYHYLAWKELANELNIPFDRKDNMRQRGVSRIQSLNILLEKADRCYSDSEKLTFATKKNNLYLQMLNKNLNTSCILDGVIETITYLKQKDIILAVASSSKNADFILNKTKLISYVDYVVTGNDIVNSKPHPEVFLKAMTKSGAFANQCIVVEDAETGVKAAKAANMKVLAVGAAQNSKIADFTAVSLYKSRILWDSIIVGF